MLGPLTIRVGAETSGTRLDAFVLAAVPGSTRAFVRDALARGEISLNGERAPKGAKVRAGDVVEVRALLEASDNRVAPDASVAVSVVYDDGWIVGVDKPAGMAVQPLSPLEKGTLAGGMVAWRPGLADVGDGPLVAGAVHRIDAGTSGLVVFAADNATFAKMRLLFSGRKVLKTYLALVEGRVERAGKVEGELVHDPRVAFCRMISAETPLPGPARGGALRAMFAATSYEPLHPAGKNTLLKVGIRTGVTHQIRAQLAMAGFPIVGDALYGASPLAGGGFRLHSLSAAFVHPVTGEPVEVAAPPPRWASFGKAPAP